jgi:hypothetical protein
MQRDIIHTQSIKDMITIKKELLAHIHTINMYKLQEDKNAHIIDWTMICCADIFMETDGDDIHVFHRINEESEEQWNQFLNKLDFEHDDESSRYALKGTVWYADGTWSKYGYDYEMMYGSWNWREVPMIPDYLHQ